jgi:hypothetical protein
MAAPICKRWELLVVGLFGSLALWGYVVAGMVKIPLPLDAAGLAAVDDVVFAVSTVQLYTNVLRKEPPSVLDRAETVKLLPRAGVSFTYLWLAGKSVIRWL